MDFHPNESAFIAWLNKNKERFSLAVVGQIDSWARMDNGEYHFFELKSQEPFTPPPFLGHGLPKRQIDKYLRMQADCNVIWSLVILDTQSYVGYRQRISVLEDGPWHDTGGGHPRRVYPVSSFMLWSKDWRETLGLNPRQTP